MRDLIPGGYLFTHGVFWAVVALVAVGTNAVASQIREGKTHQIYSAIQTGTKEGMMTMEKSLAQLYSDGHVSLDDAMAKASHPDEFKNLARLEY